MDREQLESAGTSYPYLYLQGLYGVPFGLLWFLITLTNLEQRQIPWGVLVAGLVVAAAAWAVVARHYARRFGRATPTRSVRTRSVVAAVAGFAVFVVVDQLRRVVWGRPPDVGISTMAAGWAVGMLVFYAVATRLRLHHVVVWGLLLVAGVLPVWGVGVDRDAWAFVPIGVATMASGVLDHLLLVRNFRSYGALDLESSDV